MAVVEHDNRQILRLFDANRRQATYAHQKIAVTGNNGDAAIRPHRWVDIAIVFQGAMNDFVPGYEATSFHGIAAPKGTPADVIEKLNRSVNASLADPKVSSRLADLGGSVLMGTPADFGQFMAGEIAKWGKVINFSGAKQEN